MWNTQEDEILFQHTPFGLLVSHLDMVKIKVSSIFRQHVLGFFFWWMISGSWKVAHDLLHTTQPVARAEHTSGLLIFSSAILRQHYKATYTYRKATKNNSWLFHNLIVLADSYKSIPEGPTSDSYVFNIQAQVIHDDDLTYEVTQITCCNFTNVQKAQKTIKKLATSLNNTECCIHKNVLKSHWFR